MNFKWMQFLYQLAAVVVTASWAFVITIIFVKIVDFLPFIQLRLDHEDEKM